MVTGTPCLGPVTQAGCGAICPRYGRGCYGCFGPREQANVKGLADFLQAKARVLTGDPPLLLLSSAASMKA